MSEPLTLLNIVDRLHVLVNHARAVEFACKGADLDADASAALLELTMQHHDQLKELLNELEAQTDADRERQP
ncbi:hypothetical protein AMST5_03614 [freshwater sediment metagenome]|uniref:Uncharacterized protein n=1 Tax=freshwater sediment metagenome TaxID=556182 RepID=A0AA48M4X5_9ZZZZ